MATPPRDDGPADPAAQPAPTRLRGPLSVALTVGTAAIAVVCIHFDSSGIQYVQPDNHRPQAVPVAALEFAPPTDTIELQPARAPVRDKERF